KLYLVCINGKSLPNDVFKPDIPLSERAVESIGYDAWSLKCGKYRVLKVCPVFEKTWLNFCQCALSHGSFHFSVEDFDCRSDLTIRANLIHSPTKDW